ncbi:MAG: DsbA family protein [Acidobacteriota bacterium]|nr:DsbA family protein [Acidobacteriota bacterium]
MKSFKLSYDYRCPFAKNIHLHAIAALRAGADFSIEFSPWTMSQGYRDAGAPDVWVDPAKDADLLALAVSVSIRDQQSAHFLDAHEALFRGRHERGLALKSWADVETALAATKVDLAAVRRDVNTRRPHEVIGATFREFENYEAFGVPTFVVDGDATFVRYMQAPSGNGQASAKLLDSLVTLMSSEMDLNEFKHTKVPF